MTEQELRALVRDAVARHLGAPGEPRPASAELRAGSSSSESASWRGHASHGVYVAIMNVDDACVIEPAVTCNHCQYCRSHGH